MPNDNMSARRSLILSMLIFGTIGIFRQFIELPSGLLAMARGFIGMFFLIALQRIRRRKIDRTAIRKNLAVLLGSGALIGLNWILLFEAYRYTSVSVATLCYYMAPVIVILCSPLVLREKITLKKLMCVLTAVVGMAMVSGIFSVGSLRRGEMTGVLLGLGAACLYASVILLNKRLEPIDAYDKTIVQLGAAALVLLPANLLTGDLTAFTLSPLSLALTLVVGIVHTGIAYALYFGSMAKLQAQTVALYSYIDPVASILLSMLVFREQLSPISLLGAVLILGSTLISELTEH